MSETGAFDSSRSEVSLSLPITTKRFPEKDPEPDEKATGEGCPNTRGQWFVNDLTGVMIPARCRRLACAYCVHGNARQRARAIAHSKPERAILLTQGGEDWQTVRLRAKQFKFDLQKRLGEPFEWVFHVEPNPSHDGQHHLHAWQRGAFIPQKILSAVADSAGFGPFARINKIRAVGNAASYGLKGLGYGLKGALAVETQSEYLIANGKRLTHQSPAFFLGDGGKPAPVRDSERAAASTGREEIGTWHLVSATA